MTGTWLAGALAAAAAALALPTTADALLQRRLGVVRPAFGDVASGPQQLLRWLRDRPPAWRYVSAVVLGGCLAVGLTVVVGPTALGAAVVVAGGVIVGLRLRRLSRQRHDRATRRRAVIEFGDAIAGELLAGRTPRAAVIAAAGEHPNLVRVVTAARLDGDVASALRAAGTSGYEGLTLLAAAWEVAERSGSGLADAVDRVVLGLRDEEEVHREVSGQLATPRSTARMLAILPVFGLLLSSTTGANPVEILLGTPYGIGCLLLGGLLAAGGLFWVERLARSAEAWR